MAQQPAEAALLPFAHGAAATLRPDRIQPSRSGGEVRLADSMRHPHDLGGSQRSDVCRSAWSTLEHIRRSIAAVIPEAGQGLSSGVPVFRIAGKPVAGFSAATNWPSYVPHSGDILATMSDEDLGGFAASKGALKFSMTSHCQTHSSADSSTLDEPKHAVQVHGATGFVIKTTSW